MASIGKLALQIVADQEALLSGLEKAEKRIEQFADKAGKMLSLPLNLAMSPINTMQSVTEKIFGFFTAADGKFQEIARIGKLSDKLGLDTEFIAALQLGGVSLDNLETSMRALSRTLAGLKIEGEDASGKLEHFGLETEKLARAGPQQAILQIADRYQKMTSSIERAALAQTAFGRQSAAFENAMKKGIAGLREEVDKFGMAFSRADASKVEQGLAAVRKIEHVFEGMKTQLAIGIAPYISAIAETLEQWITSGGGLSTVFRDVGKFAGNALLLMIDGLAKLAKGIEKVGEAVSSATTISPLATGYVEKLKREAAQKKGEPSSFSEGIERFAADVRRNLESIERKADEIEAKAKEARANSGAWIDEMKVTHAIDQLDKLRTKYEELLAAGGKGGHALEIVQFDGVRKIIAQIDETLRIHNEVAFRGARNAADWGRMLTDAQKKGMEANRESLSLRLRDMESLAREIDLMEKQNKAFDEGAKVFEEVMTPLERLDKQLDHLGDLLLAGAIGWQTYERAIASAGKKAEDALEKQHEFAHPKAIVQGSAEAFHMVLAHRDRDKASPNKGVEDKLERQRQIMLDMLRELGGIHGELIREMALDKIPA